jgi:hypothetical protein
MVPGIPSDFFQSRRVEPDDYRTPFPTFQKWTLCGFDRAARRSAQHNIWNLSP